MTTATSGLGFAPGTKESALYGSREHICTPEDCPPDGRYYVSCIDDDGRSFLMAGPYRTHGDALADERKACHIASGIDGRAWFMAWGTSHMREGELRQGVLNKHGKM
jgi:hypothetical protein